MQQSLRTRVKQLNDYKSTAFRRLLRNCQPMTGYFAIAAVKHAAGFQPSVKYLQTFSSSYKIEYVPLVSVMPSSTLGKVCDG